MKILYILLVMILIAGCSNSPQTNTTINTNSVHNLNREVIGQYVDGTGGFITNKFILMVPSTVVDSKLNITTLEMYGMVGELSPGNFYWTKVKDEYSDLTYGRVPATFRKLTNFQIE